MGQYQITETGEITDSDGEVLGRIGNGGKLELRDESLSSEVLRELRDLVAGNESLPRAEDHATEAEPNRKAKGSIRLACTYCDTDEADWVDEFPACWEILCEVQSVEDSLQEVAEQRRHSSAFEWYTHLGICPNCTEKPES